LVLLKEAPVFFIERRRPYFFEDFLLFEDFAFDFTVFFPLRQPQVLHILKPFQKKDAS
jgi:hypothetical protein